MMRRFILTVCLGVLSVTKPAWAAAKPELKFRPEVAKLQASFAAPELWDGKRIPKAMQCARNGGQNSHSPALRVSGLPADTRSVVVFFSNPRAWHNHGLFRYLGTVEQGQVDIPAVPSGAAASLPGSVAIFQGGSDTPGGSGAAWIGPCPSSGSGQYTVTVYALDADDTVAGQVSLDLGWAP